MPKNNNTEITQNNTENDTEPSQSVAIKTLNKYPVWLFPNDGRPVTVTVDLTLDICTLLQTGTYIETACQAVGLAKSTYYDWLKFAERDRDRGLIAGFDHLKLGKDGKTKQSAFIAFSDAVKNAHAMAEIRLLDLMDTDPLWQRQAWKLERTRQDKYGQRQQVDVTHTVRAEIEAMPEPPKTLSEALDRARLQAETARDIQAIAVDAEYKVAPVENGDISSGA